MKNILIKIIISVSLVMATQMIFASGFQSLSIQLNITNRTSTDTSLGLAFYYAGTTAEVWGRFSFSAQPQINQLLKPTKSSVVQTYGWAMFTYAFVTKYSAPYGPLIGCQYTVSCTTIVHTNVVAYCGEVTVSALPYNKDNKLLFCSVDKIEQATDTTFLTTIHVSIRPY